MDNESDSLMDTPTLPLWKSYRLLVFICCFLSLSYCYGLELSMGSALVCILETKADLQQVNFTGFYNNSSAADRGGFESVWHLHWSKLTQGWSLSAFFIGYYVMQVPTILLINRFGPTLVTVVGVLGSALGSLLTVFASISSVSLVLVVRGVTGMACAMILPGVWQILGHWTIDQENSIVFGFMTNSFALGWVFPSVVSLVTCDIPFENGWPVGFYIIAGIGFIISFSCFIVLSDTPSRNKHISSGELVFLEGHLPESAKQLGKSSITKTPFKAIFSSLPFWAIVVSQIANDSNFYFLLTVAPQYLKEVIRLSEATTNSIHGFAALAMPFSAILMGKLAHHLMDYGKGSKTTARKVFDALANMGAASTWLIMGYLPEGQPVWPAIVITLNYMLDCGNGFSWMANMVDIAPDHAGTIVVLSQILAMWVSLIIPVFVESITEHQTRSEWQIVFYAIAGIEVACLLFYLKFASGERQPWSGSQEEDKNSKDKNIRDE